MHYLLIILVLVLANFTSRAGGTNLTQVTESINTHNESVTNEPFTYKKEAKIIVLNKITAKSELVTFKLGEEKFFGNLSIEVKKCAKTTDLLRASALILIEIFDNRPDDDRLAVFTGWIDSSNPSISTIEHPIYEVIAKDCVN